MGNVTEENKLLDYALDCQQMTVEAQSALQEELVKKVQLKLLLNEAIPWLRYTLENLREMSKKKGYVNDRCIFKEIQRLKSIIQDSENEI